MLFKRKKNQKTFFFGEPYIEANASLCTDTIKQLLSDNEDIVFREITIHHIPLTIAYFDGLIDANALSNFIIKPLKQEQGFQVAKNEKDILQLITEGSLYSLKQQQRFSLNDTVNDLLGGQIALIFNKEKTAFCFEMAGFEKRSITEPSGEQAVKGARDSFVETLRTNIATIRRRIKSHHLRVESILIGQRSKTKVDIIYMKDICNDTMIQEIKKRLQGINEDVAISTSFLDEYIVDHKYITFPHIIYTQRPDKFCADIVEGRVGVIVDGLPNALIMPATFLQCLQTVDDYAQDFIITSILRVLRFFLMLTTLYLPSLFIATTTFHQGLLPSELAVFIKASKEGVPFPPFLETVFMLMAFEILTEAGLRLPKEIGQTISIVGAVVIGQAAVDARLVSPTVVVVIALTAISGYAMPNQDFSNALRLWRSILVILSAVMGLFGVLIGSMFLLMILCSVESFGVPYLAPMVSSDYRNLKDALVRMPIPSQEKRPLNLKTKNVKRR